MKVTVIGYPDRSFDQMMEQFLEYQDVVGLSVEFVENDIDSMVNAYGMMQSSLLNEKRRILCAHSYLAYLGFFKPNYDMIFYHQTGPNPEPDYESVMLELGIKQDVVYLPSDPDLAADQIRERVEEWLSDNSAPSTPA